MTFLNHQQRIANCLGYLALMTVLTASGCTPQQPEPEKAGAATAAAPKKASAPAAPASDRLHQSFLEAVSLDPPEGQLRPPDRTKAGKNVAKLYETIAGHDGVGGQWDKIRFTAPPDKRINYTATIKTDQGDIRIEFLPQVAPNHVRNFVALSMAGYYDGLEFDRAVYEELPGEKGKFFECLQAACPLASGDSGYGSIGYWLKPELSDDLKHEPGTVGAWHGEQVESAACKFYITLDQAPWMDGNYTVFGKVTQGLDVARKIRARPVKSDERDRPERPIVITTITVDQVTVPGGMGPRFSCNGRTPLMAANVKTQVEEAQKKLDLANKKYTAELDTTKGPLRVTFFPEVAPGHVKNFLALAQIGFYNGVTFHRVIKGFMIQGGCPQGTGTGGPGYQIAAEFNNTPHEAGVLSMARTNDPNSAGSQFFICLERTSHLDRQYTAFGKLADAESMKTLQAIGEAKTDRGDRPLEKVTISKVTVTEQPK